MNRIKCHVKKGDQVEVISGNFRGSSGRILAVFPGKQRVLVEGVRIMETRPVSKLKRWRLVEVVQK